MDNELFEDFKRYGKLLDRRGLNMTSKSGNLSVRKEDIIYITRRGTTLGDIQEEDIIEMSPEEEPCSEASMEAGVHNAIYRDTGHLSVIHAHTPFAIALSLFKDVIVPLDAEGRYHFDEIPLVDVENPIGSKEVENVLPPVLKDNKGVVVKGHGTFTCGDTLEEAYYWVTVIESICHIVYLVSNLEGNNP